MGIVESRSCTHAPLSRADIRRARGGRRADIFPVGEQQFGRLFFGRNYGDDPGRLFSVVRKFDCDVEIGPSEAACSPGSGANAQEQ